MVKVWQWRPVRPQMSMVINIKNYEQGLLLSTCSLLNYSYPGAMMSPTANFPRPQKEERTSNYLSVPISPPALEMAVLKNHLGMDLRRQLIRQLMEHHLQKPPPRNRGFHYKDNSLPPDKRALSSHPILTSIFIFHTHGILIAFQNCF